ncbi:MAG TPA: thioesterase domain-containing protein [Candidatus Dormibacteraeota bacterium]|nr:thioesterase domain-containing protein [Candidatus Dormibacteraeota bacterium]
MASVSSPEPALRRLWADVLRVAAVGPSDDFFDLGGDSILLLQMLSGARELGVDLDPGRIGEFLEESTCTRLLELTGNDRAPDGGRSPGVPDADITAITLRPGDGADAVFVLLPTMHDLWAVRELSAQIEEASLRVLVPAWSPARPYRSLPELGAAMAATITAVQPDGPYRIVGSCAAGQAAVEAASRLAASGRAVDLLALVDTQPPRPRTALQPLHRLLAIRPGSWGVPPALFAKLLWLDLLRASGPPDPDALMRHLWTAVRAHVGELLRFIVEVEPERWTDGYRERAVTIFMTWLNYQLASEAYERPSPYAGRVTMVYGERPDEGCAPPAEAAAAWARLTGCAYDLETFDQDHTSAIMSNPVVVGVMRRALGRRAPATRSSVPRCAPAAGAGSPPPDRGARGG